MSLPPSQPYLANASLDPDHELNSRPVPLQNGYCHPLVPRPGPVLTPSLELIGPPGVVATAASPPSVPAGGTQKDRESDGESLGE